MNDILLFLEERSTAKVVVPDSGDFKISSSGSKSKNQHLSIWEQLFGAGSINVQKLSVPKEQ